MLKTFTKSLKIMMHQLKSHLLQRSRRVISPAPLSVFGLGFFIGFGFYLFFAFQYQLFTEEFGKFGPNFKFFEGRQNIDISIDLTATDIVYHHDDLVRIQNTVIDYMEPDAKVLKDSVTVSCLVFRTRSDLFRRRTMKTWGRRCNSITYPPKSNDTFGSVSLAAITTLYKDNPEANWYLITSDSVYVCLENLRYFLQEFDHSIPYQLGHALIAKNFMFISGYPGYVLSNEALRRLVVATPNNETTPACRRVATVSYNFRMHAFAMGRCLSSIGVQLKDTRDALGRLRFIPLELSQQIALSARALQRHRVYAKSFELIREGFKCCSDVAIMFGMPERSKALIGVEYLLYRARVFGGAYNVSEGNGKEKQHTVPVVPLPAVFQI